MVDDPRKLRLVPPPANDAVPGSAEPENTPPLEARQDDELMLLARGGLEAAFDTLVRRHQARALRVAARFLGRGALAPDAVQNAFLEIYRGLTTYRPLGRFPAYLYRVLVNQCRIAQRSGRVEMRALDRLLMEESDVAVHAEEQILAREQRRELDRALARLSERLRAVVLLRYSAGLSLDEIADSLEIPLGTVKRRLFDALAKLEAAMEEKP
jgi:RNA polymerase sigma-70 factor (ECF subfamily)